MLGDINVLTTHQVLEDKKQHWHEIPIQSVSPNQFCSPVLVTNVTSPDLFFVSLLSKRTLSTLEVRDI